MSMRTMRHRRRRPAPLRKQADPPREPSPKNRSGSLHDLLARRARERFSALDQATKQPHRLIVELLPLPAAFLHQQWGPSVMEMMIVAGAGAAGVGPKRECFICSTTWTMTLTPAAILCVALEPIGHGLVAGICQACVSRGGLRQRVTAGLVRDLGVDPTTCREVHLEGGHA